MGGLGEGKPKQEQAAQQRRGPCPVRRFPIALAFRRQEDQGTRRTRLKRGEPSGKGKIHEGELCGVIPCYLAASCLSLSNRCG